jgi:hypothetical protein
MLTICNYENYQGLGNPEGQTKGKQKGKERATKGQVNGQWQLSVIMEITKV